MSETDQLDWVERRHAAEGHLAGSKAGLWRDLCAALTDACRNFNRLYDGKAEVKPINGHRFRVLLSDRDREIDLDFDEQICMIAASYDKQPWDAKNFVIKADHLSAFIVDAKNVRMTVDEVSESVLEGYFFPDR